MNAQDLRSHQWKERVVVVYSSNLEDQDALHQLELFRTTEAELKDRQMVVYHISPAGYRYQFAEEILAISSKLVEEDYKVILIGLDGGIKYESNTVEPAQVYYRLIDKMPMRRSQMRKRIKNGG